MNHPTLVIPFALPPAEHAKDLVQHLKAESTGDGLALLLSRCSSVKREQFDDFSLTLPHEICINLQRPPMTSLLEQFAQTLPVGTWFIVHPVHLHVASNHLVLTDYRGLDLRDNEAQLLFEQARTIFADSGHELIFVNANHWLLGANDWQGLQTASPDAACGHNIDIWSPQGDHARSWRRLQNEIQMEWFINPVQQQREQRGAKPVNGLWLSAGSTINGPLPARQPAAMTAQDWLKSPEFTVLDQLSASALAVAARAAA